MYTLAIVNQKGGVGKTTTAVTLAHGLARAGRKTLLVDLDAQGNVADALGLQKAPGLYELLIDKQGYDAAVPSQRQDLGCVLSDKTTAQLKQLLVTQLRREMVLKKALAPFERLYDVVVLDLAPGVDVLQVAAFVAADGFIIPVKLDHLAVIGAGDALQSVRALKEADVPYGRFLGVLPTFWDRTTNESHEQLVYLAEHFQRLVWPPIPVDTKAREAPAHGETLWEYAAQTRALHGVRINGSQRGGYAQVLERLEEVLNGAETD
jgi:chromosome partitioning protein